MAGFLFGVRDCKIASWTSTGTYGTAQDVVAISQVSVEIQTSNAQLEGDDSIVDVHAVQTVGQVTFRFGFRDREVYNILTGADISTSGTSYYTTFDAETRPYFGLAALIYETNGTGSRIVFVPKLKVMEAFQIQSQYGQYATPELTAMAVADGTYGIMRVYDYASLATIALPPTFP